MQRTIRNKLGLRDEASHLIGRLQGINIETDLTPYLTVLEQIRNFDVAGRPDLELRKLADDYRKRARDGETIETLMPAVFALIAEVSARVIGLKPFDVQILAAAVLHRGKLAQMQTGEGKTLAAAFAAALNALAGEGVHVITANDYLAGRDAEWMGPIYRFLGLTVGVVREGLDLAERKEAYLADVTYLTAKEAGFDLLRDQLRYSTEHIVQRDFHYAIVDEADFILIDEARVPLVIAGTAPEPEVDPRRIEQAIPEFVLGTDFGIDRDRRGIHITLEGQNNVQRLLGCGGIHEEEHRLVYAAVNVALLARHLLQRDVDYIVRDGKIELVDEFTGRVADKRRWPYGIQAAVEAKEGLDIQPDGMVYGSITIQHFINLYPKVAGMTATAVSAATELVRFYGLDTVIVPPNRPSIRLDAADRVFTSIRAKMAAVVEEVTAVHETGRPILVGTTSVRESQSLADELRRHGTACAVLNARNDEQEAEIVARAGMLGAVTISTNMAGRGTDIKLGGEDSVGSDSIRRLGGLYVIGTSRHESVRVDNQLRGRAGRQGDPGSSCFFVSLEDQLMERYGVMEFIPAQYLGADSEERIADPRVASEIARAQRIIESQNHEIRRTLRRYSELVEKQRKVVHSLRRMALLERGVPEGIWEQCAARCKEHFRDVLLRVFLFHLDRFWADHLMYVEELREGIHLQRLGGEEPLLHFIRCASDAFAVGLQEVERLAADGFNRLDLSGSGDGLLEAVRGPSSTWTYQINDDPLPGFRVSLIGRGNIGFASLAAAVVAVPLLVAAPFVALIALIRRVLKRKRT